jgi:hypothetical protein
VDEKWDPEEWLDFVIWSERNGADVSQSQTHVVWRHPEKPELFHREGILPAYVSVYGVVEWWDDGHPVFLCMPNEDADGAVELGGGFSHVPGEPWLEAKWKAFELWASRNGATVYKDAFVFWDDPDTKEHHRQSTDYPYSSSPYPTFVFKDDASMTWFYKGTCYHGMGCRELVQP